MNSLIILIVGIVSGVLSALGVGGGVILIPILTEFLEYSQIEAQLTNLIYFVPTGIISVYIHNKNNLLEKEKIKKMIPFSILGTIIGTVLSLMISTEILAKLFGVFLVITGVKQFFYVEKDENGSNDCN